MNENEDDLIKTLVDIFKTLYEVAQRKHPEWFTATNDNRKSTSDIDMEYDYNGHKGEKL